MTFDTESGLVVELDREGQGRYFAFALHPAGGRVRCGIVLGGRRRWQVELIGRTRALHARSIREVAEQVGAWARTQPGLNTGMRSCARSEVTRILRAGRRH